MPDPLLPQPPSPTGTPILPQWAVRVLTVAVIVAGAASTLLPEGPYRQAALFIGLVGAGFGIASPGVRR